MKAAATIKVRDKNLREISQAEVNLALVTDEKTNAVVQATFDAARHCFVADLVLPVRASSSLRRSRRPREAP